MGTINKDYWIRADRLLETTNRSGIKYYDWPIHLGEKYWTDMHYLIPRWVFAIRHNKLEIDDEVMARTISKDFEMYLYDMTSRLDQLLKDHSRGYLMNPLTGVELLKDCVVTIDFTKLKEVI